MTVARGLALLLGFAVLAVATVTLRSEETRLTARIQQLRGQRVELRRESWALQLEIARLKAPRQIRERVDRWRLQVLAPGTEA
ncbi:MAG: hypothetical protein IID40_10485, partial [Planctomycetes bacterium]|nr:hypothetical protein [Planctomycetota bacterium]